MIFVKVNLLFTDSNSLLQPEKEQQQQQQKKTERLLCVGLPQLQLHYSAHRYHSNCSKHGYCIGDIFTDMMEETDIRCSNFN